ncbi:uncharacterized protein LOC122267960, partial [Penaeus japonicus]|uniref:uncharacterized protein LOC122267960 n=1 Tax=Penaeus japonicus TaxID=27405 RepID=UPI001C70CF6E
MDEASLHSRSRVRLGSRVALDLRRSHGRRQNTRPPEDAAPRWQPENLNKTCAKEQLLAAPPAADTHPQEAPTTSEGGAKMSSDTLRSLDSVTSSTGSMTHHTPVKSRDIGVDMEAIRLSRQDNPYLQKVAGSQATLTEEEEAVEGAVSSQNEDRTQLVAQQRRVSQESALSLSEVHEHLIRSPPPTTLPKTFAKNVFVFPIAKGGLEDATMESVGGGSGIPGRAHSLNPLVTRGHEDVLDHHLRQILNTQRQLVVNKGRH